MPAQPQDAELDELIRMGAMAPSGGNAQPWKALARSDAIEVSLDLARTGTFLDVGLCASIFSLGSFVENICVASTSMGLSHQVEVHELQAPSDTVVTIRYLERPDRVDKDALYEQIPRRHTNRHLHAGACLPEATIDALRGSIRQWPLVSLCAISQAGEKKRAAAILGKGDALLLQHRVLFSEMMRELRWTKEEADRSRDGVAISTLELPNAAVFLLRALRKFPPLRKLLPRGALEKMPEPGVMGCSHLCTLSVRGALSTESIVNAGRALQRVWLTATGLQLSVQPLAALPFLLLRAQQFDGAGLSASETQGLIELGAELRALYSLGEDEFPLFIFRLSSPSAAASDRALRRPHESLYLRD